MLKANPNVSFPRNLPCLIATHCGHYDEAPGARLNSGSLTPTAAKDSLSSALYPQAPATSSSGSGLSRSRSHDFLFSAAAWPARSWKDGCL